MYPLTGTSKTTSNGAFTVTIYVTLIVLHLYNLLGNPILVGGLLAKL